MKIIFTQVRAVLELKKMHAIEHLVNQNAASDHS